MQWSRMRFFVSGFRIFGLQTGIVFSLRDLARLFEQPSGQPAGTPQPSFVYVIRGAHNVCKIGVSTNPMARLAQIKTGSPFPVSFAFVGAVNGDGYDIEAKAHQLLSRCRVQGEWFDCQAEMAIAAVNGAAASLHQEMISIHPSQIDAVIRMKGPAAAGEAPRTVRAPLWPYLVLAGVFVLFVSVTGETNVPFLVCMAFMYTLLARGASKLFAYAG
jgi:hypothetical protein